jgi:hypothetical protein
LESSDNELPKRGYFGEKNGILATLFAVDAQAID